jgi:hypothetical protein
MVGDLDRRADVGGHVPFRDELSSEPIAPVDMRSPSKLQRRGWNDRSQTCRMQRGMHLDNAVVNTQSSIERTSPFAGCAHFRRGDPLEYELGDALTCVIVVVANWVCRFFQRTLVRGACAAE